MRWSNSIGVSNDFYVGERLGYLALFLASSIFRDNMLI